MRSRFHCIYTNPVFSRIARQGKEGYVYISDVSVSCVQRRYTVSVCMDDSARLD